MVSIPADELMAMPYDAATRKLRLPKPSLIIELGNKRNKTGLYREFYEAQGYSYVCLDWNGQDGAIPFDMGKPLPDHVHRLVIECDVSMVTNFGFLEHVYTDQVQAWKNFQYLSSQLGTYVALSMPTPGYWEHHGVYQPSMSWLNEWFATNGYDIHTMTEYERSPTRHMNVIGAKRFGLPLAKYHHPDMSMVHITPVAQRRNPHERGCGIAPQK